MADQASELRKLHEPGKWAMKAAKNYLGSPQYEANGTKESWKRVDIACEVEYLKLARIIDAEAGTDICHGTFVGELDGAPMLGTIFDGTDAACPGWWRGHDNGYEGARKKNKVRIVALEEQNIELLEMLKRMLPAAKWAIFDLANKYGGQSSAAALSREEYHTACETIDNLEPFLQADMDKLLARSMQDE